MVCSYKEGGKKNIYCLFIKLDESITKKYALVDNCCLKIKFEIVYMIFEPESIVSFCICTQIVIPELSIYISQNSQYIHIIAKYTMVYVTL